MDLAELIARPALASAHWSIQVSGPDGGRLRHQAHRLLRTASLGKLFLLVEVADLLERGLLSPSAPVRRERVAPVADSGLWQHLATDTLPVADAAALVGAVSDNWATNALIDLVGLDAVQRRAAQLAPGGSTLHDLVRADRGLDDPPTLSEGCAADHAEVMAGLAAGTVVGRAVSSRVLGWLAPGADLSMVASALDLDPLAHAEEDRGVRLWNKTGTDSSLRADVGLVTGPAGTASYAVICAWDPGHDCRADVLAAMREIGGEVARIVGAPCVGG